MRDSQGHGIPRENQRVFDSLACLQRSSRLALCALQGTVNPSARYVRSTEREPRALGHYCGSWGLLSSLVLLFEVAVFWYTVFDICKKKLVAIRPTWLCFDPPGCSSTFYWGPIGPICFCEGLLVLDTLTMQKRGSIDLQPMSSRNAASSRPSDDDINMMRQATVGRPLTLRRSKDTKGHRFEDSSHGSSWHHMRMRNRIDAFLHTRVLGLTKSPPRGLKGPHSIWALVP